MKRPASLVVFVGPSLSADEVRALGPCTLRPPARQGDVWRALALEPRALVLLDGVFEAQPSVWHHELLAALEAGVAVFGGSSMGALRAAELSAHGMVGVGDIYEGFRSGRLVDDAEVALLHADAEHGYRALTVPLVNVRHNAARAQAARVLDGREARGLVEAGAELFYQERRWPQVVAAAAAHWRPATRARWDAWVQRAGLEDLKRLDALRCLEAAHAFLASGAPAPRGAPQRPSSLVRRRRLQEGAVQVGERAVVGAEVLALLDTHPDAAALTEVGLRRALLAGWARTLGLQPTAQELARTEAAWWAGLGVPESRREAFLAESGLDAAELRRLLEERALETLVLAHAERLLPDGPSPREALGSEARLRGLWAEAARALARPARRRRR
ncbi:hypothetical protein FGE12_20655 [Aggregicoccus sp. 17bor-14]|uniref:TfuA-like protein n=1 Tax=Myxococcaceae TaxID=31 RepID=UPI0012F28D47|nr:hypothetical protein [Simulacricoccus sp. 17bor-14]MRI90566.1 hypothetical protein [Aggregicoccus sp. 17bor-14]